MIFFRLYLIIALLSLLLFASCEKESPNNPDRVIIGVPADIESLNPLYSFSATEGNISMILFLGLVRHSWNEFEGKIITEPMLAERWEWNNDSTSIMLYLRDDVLWSDSVQFTSEDVVFSFDLYSDAEVQSKYYGTFTSFYTKSDLSIDIQKTFEIISPFQIKVNFLPGSAPNLFNLDYPLLPKHNYDKINRENFVTESVNIKTVTSGAYKLDRWNREQAIFLKANKNSFLYSADMIEEIIFKVVPDYTSRVTQLKQGEISLMEDVKPDDVERLKNHEQLIVIPIKGREYEYIGWNNIDPIKYNKTGKIAPHKLFGNSEIRRALTYAINREEILEEYLFNHGQIATGPLAPIFKNAFNSEIEPYLYNPSKAKEILTSQGWIDKDNDGILEKNNIEFSFTLYIPAGNPRRNFTATLVKNNLKAVGIDVNVATLEMGVFIEDMFAKKLDAWLASWSVAIPVELKPFWYSDLKLTPLNAASYQNPVVDRMLLELTGKLNEQRKK